MVNYLWQGVGQNTGALIMKARAGEFIKTNSGEVIWGSEAFIDELFKTLYGNEFRNVVESYNDALQEIKNLVQQSNSPQNW